MSAPTATGNDLPPLGSIDLTAPDADRGYAHTFVSGLVQECMQSRDPWILEADRNLQIFSFGADPTPDDEDLVVNAIQNAVIAVTDIQTKEPPKATLDPVETGEPGDVYWNGPAEVGIQLGLAPEQVMEWVHPETGDAMHPMPLDELQGEAFKQMAAGQEVKPEWVVEVNDQTVADTYQGLFDVVWRRSRIDRQIRSNILWTNVFGWTMWLYEWDDERKRFVMRPMSVRQVYCDPTVEDVDEAAYAGVELVVDAHQAKQLYPQIADDIDEHATDGLPPRPAEGGSFGQSFEQVFRRKVIHLRVFWLRDQPCLYPPQVAIERGLVELREVPDAVELMSRQSPPGGAVTNDIHARAAMDAAELAAGGDPMAGLEFGDEPSDHADADDGADPDRGGEADQAGLGEAGAAVSPAGGPLAGGGGDDGGDGDRAGNAEAGEPLALGGVPAGTPMRAAMFKPGTDEELTEDHPDWPTYSCLRQITLIQGIVVDDRECESFDIPILHNRNVPLSQRPWGIGEPYRLWKLQKAESRMMNALVEHCEYFKAPVTVMSQSMADSLVERYKDAYVKPGRTLIVDDEQWNASGGKLHNVMEPPQTPPALVGMREMLKGEITELSGYSDVLQGRAQPGVESGRAIELLQTAASSMIGYKSAMTGDFVYRFAMHALHSLVWRMSDADVARIVSRYKPGVLAAITERARSIEWDVSVTISSGNGTVLSRKKQDAQNDLGIGAITMETYREKAGIDNRVEEDREKRAAERMMTMPGAMAGGQPPSGGGQGGGGGGAKGTQK